jgi:hypothetical protein
MDVQQSWAMFFGTSLYYGCRNGVQFTQN